eukprot:SAG31_NODE_35397_length_323_cov_1.156250_1_plen_71_part_10
MLPNNRALDVLLDSTVRQLAVPTAAFVHPGVCNRRSVQRSASHATQDTSMTAAKSVLHALLGQPISTWTQ